MDVEDFCRQSRVVIVLGKGGVGKTTVSATLALTAARAGLDVIVAALDDPRGVPRLFGSEADLGYDDVDLTATDSKFGRMSGRVRARMLTSNGALLEYLDDHGLARVSKRVVQTGALDVIASAIPGIKDVLLLGKVKQLDLHSTADLIVLDAPASGHAISFLTSAKGLHDVARGGPLRAQASQVMEMLSDGARCRVMIVTIAEETPVNESIETAYRLEDEVGVYLGPIVLNARYRVLENLDDAEAANAPDELAAQLRAAAHFRAARQSVQQVQVDRLAHDLALDRLELPYLFGTTFGPDELGRLADSLAHAVRGYQPTVAT